MKTSDFAPFHRGSVSGKNWPMSGSVRAPKTASTWLPERVGSRLDAELRHSDLQCIVTIILTLSSKNRLKLVYASAACRCAQARRRAERSMRSGVRGAVRARSRMHSYTDTGRRARGSLLRAYPYVVYATDALQVCAFVSLCIRLRRTLITPIKITHYRKIHTGPHQRPKSLDARLGATEW